MLENKKTKSGIHYTRYIESWIGVGGMNFGDYFEKWLKSEGLDNNEIREIFELACCGEPELEIDARPFVDEQEKYFRDVLKIDI